jgi:transcriptional regulator with XRE-family HTH domain
MLSPFGREVRKLRLDSEDTRKLKDLADALSVSSAYLSAVETGKKPAPGALVEKIADHFKVDVKKRAQLRQLATHSMKFVQLDLHGKDPKTRELATAFARRFPSLQESEVDALLQVMQREECKLGKTRL